MLAEKKVKTNIQNLTLNLSFDALSKWNDPPKILPFFQSNFDDTTRQKNFVPVNYRFFIEQLEQKMDPGVQKYIATREDRLEHHGGKTFGDVMHKIFQEPKSTATR